MKKIVLFISMLLWSNFMIASTTDTITVRIKAMRCEECAHKVNVALRKNAGVEATDFDLEKRIVKIAYNPAVTTPDSINALLTATGRYKPTAYSKTDVIKRGFGLQMADMHCANCANRIMKRLEQMEGIDSMAPHIDKHYMFIRYDANKTCKANIRKELVNLGYTPVNYYTSKNISFAYFNIPEKDATEETIEKVMVFDGVDDVNVNARRKSLSITYLNTETSIDKIISQLRAEGIEAVVPPAHECKEEQKKNE